MLKSFDFVDPKIASRIKNLEIEIKKIQEQTYDIQNNFSITKQTKERLIKYNEECEQNAKKLLEKQKFKMIDYLDKQMIEITKVNKEKSSQKICYQRTKNNVSAFNQSTKNECFTDETKLSDQMNTTARYTSRIHSFQLHSKHQSMITASLGKQKNRKWYEQNNYNSNKIKKTSTHRVQIKKMQKKINQKDKVIEGLVAWIKILRQKEYQKQKNISEKEELRQKCIFLQNKIEFMIEEYSNKGEKMLKLHNEFERISSENNELFLERNELLKKLKKLKI